MFGIPNRRIFEKFTLSDEQTNYLKRQNYTYNTLLSNAIPSNTISNASNRVIQATSGIDTYNNIPIQQFDNANRLFLPSIVGDQLNEQQTQCQNSSLDELINTQNTNSLVRCGWMYTPSTGLNPLPQLSRGSLGTRNGAFSFLNQGTNYQKWFWDLNKAKQRVLTDTCKKLKNCTDVSSPPFQGQCGYCSDLKQGIPIDSYGNPIYPSNHLTNCSPSSIFTSAASCIPPAPLIGPAGVATASSNPCTPVNGNLPLICIKQIVSEVGCSPQGSLAMALQGGSTPTDYMASARNLQSMQIYNQFSSVPLDLNSLAQGNQSMPYLFQNLSQLSSNAQNQPSTSAVGASAIDLCLNNGAISQYNPCGELTLSTPPPYDITCVQQLFLQNGGQPLGTMYPTPQNMTSFYNMQSSWGAVVSYIQNLVTGANNSSSSSEGFLNQSLGPIYNNQKDALMKLRGIQIDDPLKGTIWYGMPYLIQYYIANSANMAGIDQNGNVWMTNSWGGSNSGWDNAGSSTGWQNVGSPVPGVPATKVAISTNGNLSVLCGSSPAGTGYNLYLWNGNMIIPQYTNKWVQIGLTGSNETGFIDIASSNIPTSQWAIGEQNGVFWKSVTNGRFQHYPPAKLTSICCTIESPFALGIGMDDTIYMYGANSNGSFYPVANNTNVIKLSTNSIYNIWYINASNDIYASTHPISSGVSTIPMNWTQIPGQLRDISVGQDLTVLGTDMSGNLVQWDGYNWNFIMAPS